VNVPSAWVTPAMSTPVSTRMPSETKTSSRRAEASGSSGAISRGPASSTVTRTPKRANTWAISQPIAPPPTTTSEPGSLVARTASRLVQYGVPASPSIGSSAGRVPGFSTTPTRASYTTSPPSVRATRTRPGPSRRPTP
jgi:hypothetical protein